LTIAHFEKNTRERLGSQKSGYHIR